MRKSIIIVALLLFSFVSYAQEDFFTRKKMEFASFIETRQSDYANYRDSVQQKYTEFMKASWARFSSSGIVKPIIEEKPLPPEEYNGEDREPDYKLIEFEEIVPVIKEEKIPTPIQPILDVSLVSTETVELSFYGKPCLFEVASNRPHLSGSEEKCVSEMWSGMSACYDSTLKGMHAYRQELSLCDWAYMELCKLLSCSVYPNSDEATLFEAFLLNQSGFKIRLARDDNGGMHYLIASNRVLYNYPYFILGKEKFFLLEKGIDNLFVFDFAYPMEEPFRVEIKENMRLPLIEEHDCIITSKRYPEATVKLKVNGNLMNFYNGYPVSIKDNEALSKWQVYAQKPLDDMVKIGFDSSLSPVLKGKTELESVNILLNLVQTGFQYGSDEQIWGRDRAFFAEETLFYPYSDCEDRAILFSRLVRELLGLDVVLVYYPNHLATAVAFSTDVPGDYLKISGKRYVVCDPTYVNAPVGLTMEGLDNSKAKVVIL